MTGALLPIATLAVAATVALGGTSIGATAIENRFDGTRAGAGCSASSMPAGKRVRGVPKAAASMRRRMIAAARRCDYAALERLGQMGGSTFSFSFGADESAARFWRRLERSGEEPAPMEALVKVLAMPYTRADDGAYVWPSAHRVDPTNRDWRALRTLYTRKEIRAMRRGGSGYLGYRVGITKKGDWQYFVAGD